MLASTAFIKSSLCIILEFHKAWNYTIKSNNEQKISQNQNKLRSDKTSHVTKHCYQNMLILNLSNHKTNYLCLFLLGYTCCPITFKLPVMKLHALSC